MATKKGQDFEWSVYHLIVSNNPTKFKNDSNAKKAKDVFLSTSKDVQEGALNAIQCITNEYGKIKDVQKLSGGIEPKTDLLITTEKAKLKCSLKFGGSIQLSSGGIKNTVQFLTGVLSNLKENTNYNVVEITNILGVLAQLQEDFGDLGKMEQNVAKKKILDAAYYSEVLQFMLGSSKKIRVEEDMMKLKIAIVEEALTGKYTFKTNQDLSADHILSEKNIKKITPKLIEEIANKTSVRLRLKGRGKKTVGEKQVRMNELVVSFDTKA